MSPIKISVDFDQTLTHPTIREWVAENMAKGIEFAIVTSRRNRSREYFAAEPDNSDLFAVAEELGITEIHFTNLKEKADFFLVHPEFLFHIDDCWHEIFAMTESRCKTVGIQWLDKEDKEIAGWRDFVDRVIKRLLEK